MKFFVENMVRLEHLIPFINLNFYFREDWVAAIRMVAARLAGIEDVDIEMRSNSASGNGGLDVATIDELSAKFSVQGTSHTKSSGKKKVVSS